MQSSHLILCGSLAANVVLLVALMRGTAESLPFWGPESERTRSERVSQNVREVDREPTAQLRNVQPTSMVPLWSRIDTWDLQSVADGLRAVGLSNREVLSVLNTLLGERSLARRKALRGEREVVPYWRNPSSDATDVAIEVEFQRMMEADTQVYRRLVAELESDLADPSRREQLVRRFGNLSDEKLQQLFRIELDYDEIRRQILSAGSSGPLEIEKLRAVEQERARDVQIALTPEEFEQYWLRNSPSANFLRGRLDSFQPTEQEFKTLHSLHDSIRPEFSTYDRSEVTVRAQQQALATLNAQIEAALGPDRYADYKQALLESSQKVNNLLVRLELPLRTGAQIEEIREDLSQRAEAVRIDPDLAPAEREKWLGQLQQEARQRVGATLGGERNLAAYEDIKGWIRDLRP